MIVPPVMSITEDYDSRYRNHGLLLIRLLLTRISPLMLKRMGLNLVFMDAIKNGLRFRFDDPLVFTVQATAYSLARVLAETLLKQEKEEEISEDEAEWLDQCLKISVIENWVFIDDQIQAKTVVLQHIPQIIERLGLCTVRRLRVSHFAVFFATDIAYSTASNGCCLS